MKSFQSRTEKVRGYREKTPPIKNRKIKFLSKIIRITPVLIILTRILKKLGSRVTIPSLIICRSERVC